MQNRSCVRGFTLIELLIVVAIIAILAMIAVPNFLEAQTRSKVSRVKADLRSLATAQEAYCVDWNSYTNRDQAAPNVIEGWRQLTTPVPYVTSLPKDPFGASRRKAPGGTSLPPLYELGTGAAGVAASGPPDDPNKKGMPANTWIMDSDGPDHIDDTLGPDGFPAHTYSWPETGYPWVNTPPNQDDAVIEALTLIYDPTNGTVSPGDVFRAGGTKPAGRIFDVIYAAAAK